MILAPLIALERDIDDLVYGFVTAATWTDLITSEDMDETGSAPYEYGPEDLEPETLASIRAECIDFARSSLADLVAYCEAMGPVFDPSKGGECSAMERAGHDLYLTRAGHGAGFWDRGLGDLGERLARDCKAWGSPDTLFLDADGRISA